jgi:hypothetical protein
MDAGELDLEDLPPKALRKLIKSMLAKHGKPNDAKQSEEADKEREALSDLHEEKKGKTDGLPVTDEDMPFDLGSDSEPSDDEEDSQAGEAPEPPKKKKKGK